MGGMIAQELVLSYPDKVNKLLLYASYCGGNESVYPSNPEVFDTFSNTSGENCNILLRSASLMFPKKWRTENPNYTDLFNNPSSNISRDTILNQSNAIFSWRGTCNRLKQIANPTLIITGTDDILVPSINSSTIANRIPNSQLIQVMSSGHGLMYQCPEKFCSIISTFLEYDYHI
jgi:pimeloyl-ACP methyl ester carboxylesterase